MAEKSSSLCWYHQELYISKSLLRIQLKTIKDSQTHWPKTIAGKLKKKLQQIFAWIFTLVLQANIKQINIYSCFWCVYVHTTHTKTKNSPFIVLRGNFIAAWEPVWHFASSKWAESTSFSKVVNTLSEWMDDVRPRHECSSRREELFWQWEKRYTAEFWEIVPSELWRFSQI